MKKNIKNQQFNMLELTLHAATFALLSYVITPLLFITPSFTEPYGIIFRIIVTVLFLILLISYIFVFSNKASPILRNTLRTITILALIAMLGILTGLAQDITGVSCRGLFGETTSCTSNMLFSLEIITIHPYFFIPASLIACTFLGLGVAKSLALIAKSKQAPKKKEPK